MNMKIFIISSIRLMVRTSVLHAGNTSSTLVSSIRDVTQEINS